MAMHWIAFHGFYICWWASAIVTNSHGSSSFYYRIFCQSAILLYIITVALATAPTQTVAISLYISINMCVYVWMGLDILCQYTKFIDNDNSYWCGMQSIHDVDGASSQYKHWASEMLMAHTTSTIRWRTIHTERERERRGRNTGNRIIFRCLLSIHIA